MTTKTGQFVLIAIDETKHWNLPNAPLLTKPGVKAYGIYLVKLGEATHVCSLTPNSRADHIENVWVTDEEMDDAANTAFLDAQDNYRYENSSESSTYIEYVTETNYEGRRSEPFEVEVDEDDVHDGGTVADLLWQAAIEEAHSNPRCIDGIV